MIFPEGIYYHYGRIPNMDDDAEVEALYTEERDFCLESFCEMDCTRRKNHLGDHVAGFKVGVGPDPEDRIMARWSA